MVGYTNWTSLQGAVELPIRHLKTAFCARSRIVAAVVIVLQGLVGAPAVRAAQLLTVTLPSAVGQDAKGRLLVFARPVTQGKQPDAIDASSMVPAVVNVAGQDVRTFGPDSRVTIDLDGEASPKAFSQLPAGDYRIQVVLDTDQDYGRNGRNAGDVVSRVTTLHLPLVEGSTVALDHVLPRSDPWNPAEASPEERARLLAARPQLRDIAMASPRLSKYFGHRIDLQAWVLVPKQYRSSSQKSWPVVYVLGTGSSDYAQNLSLASLVAQMTDAPDVPQMIWVFLNYSTSTGTTEFVDSVNNGPWEAALMQELIPDLEKRFRMDARPSGRFLAGHSSGGWASLWLQVRHPDFFAGAWATAPDPVDFHDFVGVDLYAPGANMYFDAHHRLRPLVRSQDKILATVHDFVGLEEVLGHTGGTFQSFDWVFSPRAPDGSAMRMFDRLTGAVDPTVAAYWVSHYDIARQIEDMGSAARRQLSGKLHIVVGDQDTFFLNGAVEKLRAVLQQSQVPATIRILPGKNHNDLYGTREDPLALLRTSAKEMYAIARRSTVGDGSAQPRP
jgi:S-formylglutathione hydrolase FrmB